MRLYILYSLNSLELDKTTKFRPTNNNRDCFCFSEKPLCATDELITEIDISTLLNNV